MDLRDKSFSIHSSYVMQIFLLMITASNFTALGGNDTDKLALLAFKAQVKQDPFKIFSSWNESLHFCEWQGITCGRKHQRVVNLNMASLKLKGQISPHIGNLSFLRTLNLENNSFSSQIPAEIGKLFRLRVLTLAENSFSGKIPVNVSRCTNLQHLDLWNNNLTGNLHSHIGSLTKLQILFLGKNKLVGEIPSSLGNLSSLSRLSLLKNNFHGQIPNSLGQLKSLTLSFAANYLEGTIPLSIYNISSLIALDVSNNQFHGHLPTDLGHTTLHNIQIFFFNMNQFSGPIPLTISNASNLYNFQIGVNNFIGKVPDFSSLSNLGRLVINRNSFGRGSHDDLDFLSSLVNCTNLEKLLINNNNFGGSLPESISNFSRKVRVMILGDNQISGSIPNGIQNLINLEVLIAENSLLTGPLPSSIGKLQNLHRIYLNHNQFIGTIPSSIGNLTSLIELNLNYNMLEGNIPSNIGECKNLQRLGFSKNNLNGTIPKQVIGLSSLSILLQLSANHLVGSIPSEVGNLVHIGYLDLSENKLSGEIPGTLGSCTSLEVLYLNGNLLEGNIPQSLSSLKGTGEINLSQNNLSGKIPTFLQDFHSLQNLNLSFNNFEGEVPVQGVFNNARAISVVGNTRLCGGIPQLALSKCIPQKKHKVVLSGKLKLTISVVCGFVTILVVGFVCYYCLMKRRTKPLQGLPFGNSFKMVTYGDLLKATGDFSSVNLIGVGSFGSVYKGILENGVVAVKVMNLQISKASRSFSAECKALQNIRHRNLLKVLTACSSIDFQGNDFKAIIYQFMENGSLEEWLHQPSHRSNPVDLQRELDLIQRINIAIDVANALDYLHSYSHLPIVHCDLKPSNILLDSDMVAHVGDFGLARFLSDASHPYFSDEISSIGLKGTIGYAAPEYGMGSEVSKYGDVYSYGILLLEIFTGKRPTDDMFKDEINLRKFVFTALSDHVDQILDPILLLWREEEATKSFSIENMNGDHSQKIKECLISILEIGIACSAELPRDRMEMSNVAVELHRLRDLILKTRMPRGLRNRVMT